MDQKKERELSELMDRYGREDVCLAFSGGVDSSLLLKLACDSAAKYHTTVWAVTFDTMLHPACDMENARRVARELNASHVVLTVDELEQEELRRNPVDRCYLCKRRLFSDLKKFAEEKGCSTILDGTNEDDLHVYRPGIRALRELGIVSPLALCGMTKQEVKELAARLGLSAAYFTRLFTRQTGQTPLACLNGIRLSHAVFLLLNTTLSIDEVALSCGFSCGNYFCKVFRRASGFSPAQYRRKYGRQGRP